MYSVLHKANRVARRFSECPVKPRKGMPISTISQFERGIVHRDNNLMRWRAIFALEEGSPRFFHSVHRRAKLEFPNTPSTVLKAAIHAMHVLQTSRHPRRNTLPSATSRYRRALG